MRYLDVDGAEAFPGTGGAGAPVIYAIDIAAEPLSIPVAAARPRRATVVRVPALAWDDSMTPWVAPGLYDGDPDFRGEADVTLAELVGEVVPRLERDHGLSPARRALVGFSLGGLFSLYAFTRDDYFSAFGCLSGSVWYPGWMDYLRGLEFDARGRYGFFSIGREERRADPPILHAVQDNIEACARICREHGCEVDYELGEGWHMDLNAQRFSAGLDALDAFLGRG